MTRTPVLLCVVLVMIAAAAGCKSGSSAKRTPTAQSTATLASPRATPTIDLRQADAIRSLDVNAVSDVRALEVKSTGARVDTSLVIYADLTGDGIEEAVVPVTLGGRAGQVGFVVLKLDSGSAGSVKAIYSELAPGTGGVSLNVDGGKLVESQAAPGPDDPECCPSMLRVTTYGWNGTVLMVESTGTIPNPAGGLKGTPPAGVLPPSGPE